MSIPPTICKKEPVAPISPSESELLPAIVVPWFMRIANFFGSLLRSLGLRVGNARVDVILKKALKRSGTTTIHDDSFREPLEILVQSANQQEKFAFLGRVSFRDTLTDFVTTRLKIDNTLDRLPEILETPITRPIFIAALPRTGTTILHRLLAQDDSLRIPRCWEMVKPCPPPEESTYATDPRIKAAQRRIQRLETVAPHLKVIHETGATEPEECILLFANDLMGDWFLIFFDLPEYVDWMNRQNLLPLYQRHKMQLQLLQSRFHRERWVLKAPSHLRAISPLLQVYPDACIIQTHRDPAKVIASMASLVYAFWSIYHTNVSPEAVGKYVLDLVSTWLQKGMKDREHAEKQTHSAAKFIDVGFAQLVARPLDTIREIYQQCNLEWSHHQEEKITEYLRNNPPNKHGSHRYNLAQFGLREEEVRERFSAYTTRFKDFC